MDRSDWEPGPWDSEPDRVEFEFEGFPCLIRRVQSGAFCGYVGVPPGHPVHGVHKGSLPVIHVHGGVTFTGPCEPEQGICHTPKPGEPEDVWWLGFDCAHAGVDRMPGFDALCRRSKSRLVTLLEGYYRTLEFVRSQCVLLALQLRDMGFRAKVMAVEP